MRLNDDMMRVLQCMMVPCRDNGSVFTVTDRLDAIAALLKDSEYIRVETDALCHLYARKPLEELPETLVVFSAHVDCESHLTRFFAEEADGDGEMLRGTFDNAATDAALVYHMMQFGFAEHIVFAFTGDEEENGRGAVTLARFLKKKGKRIQLAIVTDVTEEAFDDAYVTLENNFWEENDGKKLVSIIERIVRKWKFVPEDPCDIPWYIPQHAVIPQESAEDESWDYDEEEVPACSICVPVRGDMHSDAGVLMKAESFEYYINYLGKILVTLEFWDGWSPYPESDRRE